MEDAHGRLPSTSIASSSKSDGKVLEVALHLEDTLANYLVTGEACGSPNVDFRAVQGLRCVSSQRTRMKCETFTTSLSVEEAC